MKAQAFSVFFTREAKKNIDKLDPSAKKILRKAIESLASDPYRGKPLSYELAGLRSWRTSDYRIIYRIKGRELVILVIAVGHRKQIYKKLQEILISLKRSSAPGLSR